MDNPTSISEITSFMITSLADLTGDDPSRISPESSLVNDLDMDSLDLAELIYKAEKHFNIEFPKKNILEAAAESVSDADRFVHSGRLTEAGAQILFNSLGKFTESQVSVGMYPAALFYAVTLRNWINTVHALFDFLPSACPECGHNSAEINSAGKVACASCSSLLRPLSGNEAQLMRIESTMESEALTSVV